MTPKHLARTNNYHLTLVLAGKHSGDRRAYTWGRHITGMSAKDAWSRIRRETPSIGSRGLCLSWEDKGSSEGRTLDPGHAKIRNCLNFYLLLKLLILSNLDPGEELVEGSFTYLSFCRGPSQSGTVPGKSASGVRCTQWPIPISLLLYNFMVYMGLLLKDSGVVFWSCMLVHLPRWTSITLGKGLYVINFLPFFFGGGRGDDPKLGPGGSRRHLGLT